MAYIDWGYFTNSYYGVGVTETNFTRFEARAEELIDQQTRFVVKKKGLTSFPNDVQELIKKAVCSQVEYYGEYGLNVGFGAEDTGFTVGKVSVQAPNQGTLGDRVKHLISPRALGYLEQTGLLNRSVTVC